jgi:acetylornithine deacetylase/succinyl-diaminopimelate desuccinylase-like protein
MTVPMRYGLVERRRRAAARVALYGGLVLVGLATWAGRSLLQVTPRLKETRWFDVDWKAQPSVRVLQQYLRIDTTEATGDELAAAVYLSTPLEAAGIPVRIERIGKHAVLLAELAGADPHPLVLLSHMDVEPVPTPEEWLKPPFAGVVEAPYIHGRGSFDMKSYTVAQLFALLGLQARHPRPTRSVLLLASGNEEAGSDLGMRWVIDVHPELLHRFWAVLNEGGIVEARALDNIKYWGIEVGQKRFADLYACAPTRERLEDLRRDITTFGFPISGADVDPEVRRFWSVYRSSRDLGELRQLLADPDELRHDPARFAELPDYLKSMLRNELVAFEPEPAHDGGWQMRLIFHLLPSADLEALRREMLPDWMTAGVRFSQRGAPPPLVMSPADHPVVKAIEAEVDHDHGPVAGPYFLPWSATDSRFVRPLGIPSYGFAPFLLFTPETERMGRNNEKISLPGYVGGVDLYTRVVERLAAPAD